MLSSMCMSSWWGLGAQEVCIALKNIAELSAGYLYRAKLLLDHIDMRILFNLLKCCLSGSLSLLTTVNITMCVFMLFSYCYRMGIVQ